MGGPAESALEHLARLNLHALGAFVHLVPNHLATLAHDDIQGCFRQFLEQDLRVLEVFFHEDLWVMVCASSSLLAKPIHVIPTKFPHDVFVLAQFPQMAEAHIEVWAALVHVAVVTVLALVTPLFDKIFADLQIVTEIASLTIRTFSLTLILFTSLYFALVMRVRTSFSLSALPMDEFLAYPIGCKFRGIVGSGRSSCSLIV